MIMRNSICIVLSLLVMFLCGKEVAAERNTSESVSVIGVVPVSMTGTNQKMYYNIDRLVPELKKIPSERVILLECLYNGRADREQDVARAFTVAAEVEKYLREHHKLQVELWLSAHPTVSVQGTASELTFSVLSQSYWDLDRMQPDSITGRQE